MMRAIGARNRSRNIVSGPSRLNLPGITPLIGSRPSRFGEPKAKKKPVPPPPLKSSSPPRIFCRYFFSGQNRHSRDPALPPCRTILLAADSAKTRRPLEPFRAARRLFRKQADHLHPRLHYRPELKRLCRCPWNCWHYLRLEWFGPHSHRWQPAP